MTTTNNRLADYLITDSAFLSLLQGMDGQTVFRLEGLPADPVVVGVRHDPERRAFRVRIASPDHAEVAEGAPVPVHDWRVASAYRPCHRPVVLERARERYRDYMKEPVADYRLELENAQLDRGSLFVEMDRQAARIASLEAELSTLRTIFASDYLIDCDPARLAYEQGWRDAQRLAALRPEPPQTFRYQALSEEDRRRLVEAVHDIQSGTTISMPAGMEYAPAEIAHNVVTYSMLNDAGAIPMRHVAGMYEIDVSAEAAALAREERLARGITDEDWQRMQAEAQTMTAPPGLPSPDAITLTEPNP